MSENYVTYTELKRPAGKKKTQQESESCKKKKKEKKEEQLVYSELKILTSNANQTKKTKTKSAKQKAGPSIPIAWRLAVIVLGIICSVLLGILGFMVLQVQSTGQSQEPFLSNQTRENCACGKEESKEEKKPSNTGSEGRDTCKSKWSCCEDNCYYVSHDEKNFEESRQACKRLGSTLLKIEDEGEMKLIQKRLHHFSWIGLSRTGIGSTWIWEDKTPPNLKVFTNWKDSTEGNCVTLSTAKMAITDCFMERFYICEKKMKRFAT